MTAIMVGEEAGKMNIFFYLGMGIVTIIHAFVQFGMNNFGAGLGLLSSGGSLIVVYLEARSKGGEVLMREQKVDIVEVVE